MFKRLCALLLALALVCTAVGALAQERYLFGYVDESGQLVIAPQWDCAYAFSDGCARVFKGTLNEYGTPEDGSYGFINAKGEAITPVMWEAADNFSGGFACVTYNGKCGFIDTTGDLVISPQFDYVAYGFRDGYAVAFNGTLSRYGYPVEGTYHVIDERGNTVYTHKRCCTSPTHISGSLYAFEKEEQEMLVDVATGEVLSHGWQDIAFGGDGFIRIKTNDLYGFLTTGGEMVVECAYDDADRFYDGLVPVEKNGRFFVIDTQGNRHHALDCDYYGSFTTGYGYLFTGELTEYGFAEFEEGTCRLETLDGQTLTGELSIEDCYVFNKTVGWRVKQNGKWGIINAKGEWQLQPTFEGLYVGDGDVLVYKEGDLYGLTDMYGNIIAPAQWHDYTSPAEGLVAVSFEEGSTTVIPPAAQPTGGSTIDDSFAAFIAAGDSLGGTTEPEPEAPHQPAVLDDAIAAFIAAGGNLDGPSQPETQPEAPQQPTFSGGSLDDAFSAFTSGSSSFGGDEPTTSFVDDGFAAFDFAEEDAGAPADLRRVRWGMTQEEVMALEGMDYDYSGVLTDRNVNYIGYDSMVMGYNCLLAYYFCQDGVYQARYVITDDYPEGSRYLTEYENLCSAYEQKYGEPTGVKISWDNEEHKAEYGQDMGKALELGYVSYTTTYRSDRTWIQVLMATDTETNITIYYESRDIMPEKTNSYLDEI